MSYHERFDRLGNPVASPCSKSRQPLGHRIIQRASLVCIVVLLAMLYGVRT